MKEIHKYTIKVVAEALGMSFSTITKRAKRLGIKTNKNGYTARQVAMIKSMGRSKPSAADLLDELKEIDADELL